MAFWRKREDPWDMDPAKRPPARAEVPQDTAPEGEPDGAAPEAPPSLRCPWCGQEMEQGYLTGERSVWWAPGRPGGWAKWLSVAMEEGGFRVDREGSILCPYQTAWHCRSCRRLTVELTDPLEDPERKARLARTMDVQAQQAYRKRREEET